MSDRNFRICLSRIDDLISWAEGLQTPIARWPPNQVLDRDTPWPSICLQTKDPITQVESLQFSGESGLLVLLSQPPGGDEVVFYGWLTDNGAPLHPYIRTLPKV